MSFGNLTVTDYWNAATNTPRLVTGQGTSGRGYLVSAPGTTYLDGNVVWNVGDIAIFILDRWTRFTSLGNAEGALTTKVAAQSSFFAGIDAAGPSVIRTTGYAVSGDGGEATYKRVNSQPLHALWFQSADGAYWEWMDEGNGLNVLAAGAVADGDYSFTDTGINTVFTGTDNWQAIQNCIDAHTYFGLGGHVYIPTGQFRISKTLQAGYGTSFETTRIKGAGRPYAPDIKSGTWLFCDFSNQPGINGQGQRGFLVEKIGLYGLNAGWIINHGQGFVSDLDDTNYLNWIDPALNPNSLSECAPYCGIATDAFFGAANPSLGAYPDVSFPAFLGLDPTDQYNKNSSSGIYINDCTIQGFGMGVVNQPNGGVSNGDFMSLKNVTILKSVYGISIGANQSRNVLRESCVFASLFCMETTSYNGAGQGKMGGVSLNCSVGTTIKLFEHCDTAFSGDMKYISLYTEDIWQLGVLDQPSGNGGVISFESCTFGFSLQNSATRGVPANVLEGAQQPLNVEFRNCIFTNFKNVIGFANNLFGMSFKDCFINTRQSTTRTGMYQMLANNALAGGFVFTGTPEYFYTSLQTLKTWLFQLSNSTGFADFVGPAEFGYSRDFCISALISASQVASSEAPIPVPFRIKSGVQMTIASRTNREVTFVVDAGWSGLSNTMLYGPLPGDVIVTEDGTTLFVHSWDGPSRTGIAQMQSNYRDNGAGVINPINTLSMGGGRGCHIINSRVYTPDILFYGDITAGSPNVTNVGPASAPGIAGEIVNGDQFFWDPAVDGDFAVGSETISAVGATSFTMGGNATRTVAKKRLPFFIRQPPANS